MVSNCFRRIPRAFLPSQHPFLAPNNDSHSINERTVIFFKNESLPILKFTFQFVQSFGMAVFVVLKA